MNKYLSLIILLFSVLALQGMDFWKDKSKERKLPEINTKPKIQNLDDVQKMKEFQQEYRSKHHAFAQEHNKNNKQSEK